MSKSSSHVWHMVLVAGVVVVAVWLGAAWSTAFLFSALICAAMLGALVWFMVTSTRDAEKFVPGGANRNRDARVPARSFDERRAESSIGPRTSVRSRQAIWTSRRCTSGATTRRAAARRTRAHG